jgi:hypothetical protein
MKYNDEIVAMNIVLLKKLDMQELESDRYKKLWAESCARYNRLKLEYDIVKEALEHIAEHNFIPPASFVDVAADALYRIGQMEGEGK